MWTKDGANEYAPAADRINEEFSIVVRGCAGCANGRGGFVMVTMILVMVPLLAFLGLAIDDGWLQ